MGSSSDNSTTPGLDERCMGLTLASGQQEGEFKNKVQIVKANANSYVGIYQPSYQSELPSAFIKCYQPKGLANKLLGLVSKSRPFNTYAQMGALSDIFPVSTPLAIIRNKASHDVYLF